MQENIVESFCHKSRAHNQVIFLRIIAAWPCALDTGCCVELRCPKTAENRFQLQRCRTDHLSTVGTSGLQTINDGFVQEKMMFSLELSTLSETGQLWADIEVENTDILY